VYSQREVTFICRLFTEHILTMQSNLFCAVDEAECAVQNDNV